MSSLFRCTRPTPPRKHRVNAYVHQWRRAAKSVGLLRALRAPRVQALGSKSQEAEGTGEPSLHSPVEEIAFALPTHQMGSGTHHCTPTDPQTYRLRSRFVEAVSEPRFALDCGCSSGYQIIVQMLVKQQYTMGSLIPPVGSDRGLRLLSYRAALGQIHRRRAPRQHCR